jgi:pyrroline-5-carboxylate reductase
LLSKVKLAIIGGGKMGETLTSSLLDAGAVAKEQIIVADIHADRLKMLSQKYKVATTVDNREAIKAADILILCIKPQVMSEVLTECKDVIDKGKLVISIVASVSTTYLENALEGKIPVVRAMPNTPCLIKKGMTVISSGHYATENHTKQTESIFRHVGRTLFLDEKYMDAVTGLSASGPAYIYVVIESMAEGGVKVGLPRNIATELAAQAVLGAASMVLETENHPALLKDAVTTPAGCTIDGLMELEEGGIRVTLIKSIVKATERATDLIEDV